ncbi:cilia- and flagella-associated protein 337-like [Periplaneta americana]|uniref:cilia- and flagella-associated protein 337-like n=1 Tax=Periplaneta americana TaxID=6978 RepID=UPI0037E758B9
MHVEIFNMPHCKRETIVKVVPIETATTFCYAVVSKFGRVGVYDGSLQLLDSYVISLSEGDIRERIGDADGGERRRRVTSLWLTDAVHVPDANALLLACSDRSLHLYDCAGLTHAPLCHVKGMRHVPQCLAYTVSCGTNPSMLFIGDRAGNVTTMRFYQPRISLFRKKHPDKLDKYYWAELDQQGDYVDVSVDAAVHADSVQQVAYFADNETVVSCSQDPTATLVIRHVTARRTPYIFRLARGVRCFHLERKLRLLATGSGDCVVRLWNPVVTKQPVASLFGHKAAVVDLLVLRHLKAVVSCAKDGMVKVWDTDDQCCLQTLVLNFPSFTVLGKMVEFGTRSFYPGPSCGGPPTPSASESLTERLAAAEAELWQRGQILVACCDQLALLRVQTERHRATPPPLPPPSREHHASVPSPWTAAEARGLVTPDIPEHSDSRASSRSSLRSSDKSPQSLRTPASLQGLNVLRARHERRQQEMRPLVEQCAPHLALRLWDLQDIHFSTELPLTRRMRERRLDLTDPDKLARARLPSAASSAASSGRTGRSSSRNT